ncbi:hypothetical protein PVAND_017324 [Polypedilum vanderplanki]|uniref:Uncharacterized protein n=1 Tax=Polypedilum vanderplanki TaxID=319348 RepID=A0A9J6BHY8_POLVA|nr:hypothetical protein PVAND_017324 [Polypedilum vanderplanki]
MMRISNKFCQHRKKRQKVSSSLKIFTIIILMTTICSTFTVTSTKIQEDSTQSIAKVMNEFIRKFYIANDINFEFWIFGEATQHIKDVINDVTKELSNEIPVNIRHIENIQKWNREFNKSTIIMTKSKDNLQYVHQMSTNLHELYLRFTK